MQRKSRLSAERTASMSHRADDGRKLSLNPLNSQALRALGGGMFDADTLADAAVWARALECDAAFWMQRRARRG